MTSDNDLILAINESANRPFVPLAYYDQHMDCIRIELRDCSTFERRLNGVLTISYDNYPEDAKNAVAGVTIKGIKHYFKQWNLALDGIYLVADLLDRIVKEIPIEQDSDSDDVVALRSVTFIASSIELPVSLAA